MPKSQDYCIVLFKNGKLYSVVKKEQPENLQLSRSRKLLSSKSVTVLAIAMSIIGLSAQAESAPVIHAISTDFIAMTSKLSFDKTIALHGENLDTLLFDGLTIKLGPETAREVSGNSTAVNATFSLTPKEFKHNTDYYVSVYDGDQLVFTVDQPAHVSNPLFARYKKTRPRKFFRNTPRKRKPTKRNVGLNVHTALGATTQADNELFQRKLANTNTLWVREHISFAEVMGPNGRGWLERYDEVMRDYKQQGKRVVVMLAYGDDTPGRDRFVPPTKSQWRRFVRRVVKRYRNMVDAWEVWNEPDSPSYMHPNTVKALAPLMRTAYPILKHYDPNSIVLNGPIGDITNTDFVKQLYKKAGRYFDELSVHLYYCDEYVHNGNNGKLWEDWAALELAIPEHRRRQKVWVTELGCSTGDP